MDPRTLMRLLEVVGAGRNHGPVYTLTLDRRADLPNPRLLRAAAAHTVDAPKPPRVRVSRYTRHQGQSECARRLRQCEGGN